MRGILADINVIGHLQKIHAIIKHDQWTDVWTSLNLRIVRFDELGLRPKSLDSDIWKACQAAELVLFTNNRNHDGPDSLEAAIRENNNDLCLPVFTLANENRFQNSREYASKVVEDMMEYLLDIDDYRGTGRLYLPRSIE